MVYFLARILFPSLYVYKYKKWFGTQISVYKLLKYIYLRKKITFTCYKTNNLRIFSIFYEENDFKLLVKRYKQ